MFAILFQSLYTVISQEKYCLWGFLDKGATFALAYNRVKTRVTLQIETQVNVILDCWFVSEKDDDLGICTDGGKNYDEPQAVESRTPEFLTLSTTLYGDYVMRRMVLL